MSSIRNGETKHEGWADPRGMTMSNIKTKWGAQTSYWIPAFLSEISDPKEREQIRKEIRAEITKDLGRPPTKSFFEAAEALTEDFIAWTKYRTKEPTTASVKAAIKALCGKVDDLAEMLSPDYGIDARTRQFINQIWYLRGMRSDPIQECMDALDNLSAAIEMAKAKISKQKIPKGRKVDTKQEFVYNLFELFQRFGLKPKTTRYGSFEQCCMTLLHVATKKEPSTNNIHKLALAAAKHCRTT
jgi:hypothetical protein